MVDTKPAKDTNWLVEMVDFTLQLKSFYLSILGILFLQVCGYVIAYYSARHNKSSEFLVKSFFIVIQTVLMLIFENRMHIFQYRILICLYINGLLILGSIEANPVLTFALLMVISQEYYSYFTKPIQAKMDQALEEDIRFDLRSASNARYKTVKKEADVIVPERK